VTNLDQTQAAKLTNASLALSSAVATTGINMRLGSTSPTATTNMTQSSWTGYTAGGTAVTWTGQSGATAASNSSSPSWTNTSGSSQTINGIELWDQAGTPLRWWQGSWTGAPITLNNGNTFNVANGAVTCQTA
jgi:hypothetical protein